MKNQYAGDVGDLSKFALLRSLRQAMPEVQVGLLWYLTPDDVRGPGSLDGRYVHYEALAPCDQDLYSRLQRVAHGRRHLSSFDAAGLTGNLQQHADLLDPSRLPPSFRATARQKWFASAVQAVRDSHAVLLDPDNGIATPAVRVNQRRANKFAFRHEIDELHRLGKTVICYQHAVRDTPFESHLRNLMSKMPGAFALRWHRLQTRAYIVWPTSHPNRWQDWGRSLSSGSWTGHFTLVQR